MNMKELQDLINTERRNEKKAKTAKKFAVEIGIVAALGIATGVIFAVKSGKAAREDLKKGAAKTVGSIEDTAQKKAETVNDSAAQVVQGVSDVIGTINEKAEDAKEDTKDGFQKAAQDIHRTVESVSDDLD
jgi:gas vesicle protein